MSDDSSLLMNAKTPNDKTLRIGVSRKSGFLESSSKSTLLMQKAINDKQVEQIVSGNIMDQSEGYQENKVPSD